MSDFLGLPISDGDEIIGALFLANKRCPGAPAGRLRLHRGGRGTAVDPRPARGDRPDQRPALRAQPRADHRRGALPARPRTARRGQPEALLAAADRPGRRRPGGPRPGPRQGRAAAGRRARRRGRRRTARRRRRAAPRRPRRGRPGRHPAHPDPGPRPRPLRPGHLRPAAASARLPAAQEEALLRVAQEALHNALRHSGADRVDVDPGPAAAGARSCGVTDDGRGFDPRAVRRAGRHLGLVSMRDRASGVGGRLTVESAPGKGTTIEMEVPGG